MKKPSKKQTAIESKLTQYLDVMGDRKVSSIKLTAAQALTLGKKQFRGIPIEVITRQQNNV